MIFKNILEAIGRTPLIELSKISRTLKATILAKVEYFNPGGSIKDRIALKMIESAEKEGLLKPGGTIVEATAGNTGVGLALVAAIKGYKCIFVMPDKMSQDKISLLRAYGAEVVVVPTSVPPDSPESYNSVAERLSREIPGAFRPNQFANPENPLTHYLTTGPEIWEETNGRVDILVAGMGTGGTISGTGRLLKEKNSKIIVVGADPEGSILSGGAPAPYKVEGIGEDFIPSTFDRQVIDDMVRVSDKESFNAARRLAKEEGILAGGSAGTALAAAIKYSMRLTGHKNIVVILPDTGRNYITKMYSDKWMQENGFWEGGLEKIIKLKDILNQKNKAGFPSIISASPDSTLLEVINLMYQYNISQLPVIKDEEVIGSIHEASLMRLISEGINLKEQKILAFLSKAMPELESETEISEAYRLLVGNAGIIVTENQKPQAVITRIDLINHRLKEEVGLKQ